MAHHTSRDCFPGSLLSGSAATSLDPAETDLTWPFGDLYSLDREDIRETAYEVFFTACRSSPGFGGGRNAITFYSSHNHDAGDSGGSGSSSGFGSVSSGGGRLGNGPLVVTTPTSKIKRALGLKMLKNSPSRRMSSVANGGGGGGGGGGTSPGPPNILLQQSGGYSPISMYNTVPATRPRRPLTSAEIMRLQMKVTEQSDNRLRKTLMRTLVGQVRKAVCIL